MSKKISLISLGVVIGLNVSPSAFADQSSKRDNDHRQIATVIPIAPPPPVVPPVKVGVVKTTTSSGVQSEHGNAAPPLSRVKISAYNPFATPLEVSPQIKEAADKGVAIAYGLSRLALRRVADISSWVSHVLKLLNDHPQITTGTGPVIVRQPSLGAMRPIAEPNGTRKQYFTSEGRLKTVVGR